MFFFHPLFFGGLYYLFEVGSTSPESGLTAAIWYGGPLVATLVFTGYQVIKSGYFILDPERGKIIDSGNRISFADVRDPSVGSIEVSYTSPELGSMRGMTPGLLINRKHMLLAAAALSPKTLQKLADQLGPMAAEWQLKASVRRWLAVQRSPEARARRQRIDEATSGSLDELEEFLENVHAVAEERPNPGDDGADAHEDCT